MNENENKQPSLQLELPQDVAQGEYANFAIITHSSSDFIVDFARVLPGVPKAQVKSRVILAPEHAKRLLDNRQGHKDASGDPTLLLSDLQYPVNTGEKWTDEWEYLTVGAKSSTSFGTGLSLTYRYKSNFSWRVYCDYDYTRKDFTAKYDPFHFVQSSLTSGASLLADAAVSTSANEYADGLGLEAREYKTRKYMNYVTLGLSFLVNF